jgi:hypothetical protein
MAGTNVLHDTTNDATVLRNFVASLKIFERYLVAERDVLKRPCLERLIRRQIPTSAICTRADVDDCNADIICRIVN